MLFLGIDVGTFETKGVLVDAEGEIVARARRRHGLSTPRPGHVEHDPEQDWWAGLCEISAELMHAAQGSRVGAVGVSAIGPCIVAVDEELAPLRAAILYGVDTRASAQIRTLNAALGEAEILRRSGNSLTSQSAGPKIAWLRDEEPEVWRRAHWYMTSQSWLVARLTGEVTIDHGTAGYFHPLYDFEAGAWDVTGCEDFVDVGQLPRLGWASEVAGTVTRRASEATGIPVGVPVIIGTTDSPAEAVGSGVVDEGDVMAMYGSSGYFIRVGDKPITHRDLWAAPYVFDRSYVLAAGTSTTGTGTRWISDLLGITDPDDDVTFARLLDLAHESPPGARGVMALPHLAGERTPFQDPQSRAAFVGLGLQHTRADLARAMLEGIGHSAAEALLTFARANVQLSRVVAVGGATRNDIIMATVATVTGSPQRVVGSPGASYGDAFLAAHGIGEIPHRADAKRWGEATRVVAPDPRSFEQLSSDHQDFVALYRALAPLAARRAHRFLEVADV